MVKREQWLVEMFGENITKQVDFYLCREHGQDILPVHMMNLKWLIMGGRFTMINICMNGACGLMEPISFISNIPPFPSHPLT